LPDARRVVVLEADTVNRFSTERILRREDYWFFVTEDSAAAVRVASVSAIDFVFVDLVSAGSKPSPRRSAAEATLSSAEYPRR
jgi:DNA-binding response OmpR family regulator